MIKRIATPRIKPRYIVNGDNVKTDVVLPIEEYERLIRQKEKLAIENTALKARLEESESLNRTFIFGAKGAWARGRCYGPCWVVLKGSTASIRGRLSNDKYWEIKQELLKKGILVKKDDHFYEFSEDCIFDNASVAACIVENGSRNGDDGWSDDGMRLGHFKQSLLSATSKKARRK